MSEETLREPAAEQRENRVLDGIWNTLKTRGTPVQRVLIALMLAVLSLAELPGGGYCAQAAMFAVLLRLGYCVPAAFVGVVAGFVMSYAQGTLLCCWQLPVCTLLWLTSGLWARREGRIRMALAVFLTLCTGALLIDRGAVLPVACLLLTALLGAGLSLLFDGAALVVSCRDELDGDTRPLCVTAVLAALLCGAMRLPAGEVIASALACYLVMEHAYVGGGAQALLAGGMLGGVISIGQGSVQGMAMLLCGGYFAGEIKTRRRWVSALLMALGMAAASVVLGGGQTELRRFVICLPGLLPFMILPAARRAGITNLIERQENEELTQSEAVAVRCASMIHAWAGLYEDTARMMEGLGTLSEPNPVVGECVQLLRKTSAASHQVCERTLSQIHPDDAAYRRVRYALVRDGQEEVRVAYALSVAGKMEVMLTKPASIAPVVLCPLVSEACGVPMRPAGREGLLSTQALFEQETQFTLEIGAASRSRSGEDVTGDSYISRTLPGGRHVFALSDGMGSGVSAKQESHAALSLLAESLRAGYTRAQALDVVNALMLMCTGREMYATMDVCVCDLHSGEAAFEKLGATASYVIRSGEVRSLGADTLPVGVLPDVESRSLKMTLREGDVIVMTTDGVTDAYPGGEEALCADLSRLAWLHPQAVGEKLIEKAAQAGEAKDDMAVLCARVQRTQIE